MYKENCDRNKTPFLALIVIAAALLLALSGILKGHPVTGRFSVAVDIILLVCFMGFLFASVKSIKTVLKYSLISGELLIQKKVDGKSELVDRIYIDSITSIKPVNDIQGRLKCGLKDISCFFIKTYKVSYKKDGVTKTVYLRPTGRLIEKLEAAVKK